MTVRIRLRLTPFWRRRCARRLGFPPKKARPERIRSFPKSRAYTRAWSPFAMWVLTILLMTGLLSMSMFATLPVASAMFDEDDPPRATEGRVVTDCRVMIERNGALMCLPSLEYQDADFGSRPLARRTDSRSQ